MNEAPRRRKHLRMVVLSSMVILALAATSCGEGDETTTPAATGAESGTPTSTGAASGCAEVTTLRNSLTALTQVDVVNDGTDALQSAATEVRTDLDAAASAVSSELQPAVDEVETAFGDLETALEGVTSADGLGDAATEVGSALTQVGTALTDLSTEIGQIC